MKIFISHSSKDSDYGNALVDLLTGVGINSNDIIFTSNDAYGIPSGQNTFNWLKDRISEGPYIIYLLSPHYYTSVACLNEMGAAWIVENRRSMIFTPTFDLDSYEFQNGALDPREMGFYIDKKYRITEFIETLKNIFNINSNQVLIIQKIDDFISKVEDIKKKNSKVRPIIQTIKNNSSEEQNYSMSTTKKSETDSGQVISSSKSQNDSALKFDQLIIKELTDEEVLLFHYIMDTGRIKLGTGWQEGTEVENIRAWEEIRRLDSCLSDNYSNALRKLQIRTMTEVSEVTSHNNPKEVTLVENIRKDILNPSEEVKAKISEIARKHWDVWS